MYRCLPFFLIIYIGSAQCVIKRLPIKSNVVLKPGEIYKLQIEAAKPTEIGWETVPWKACTTDCVQATELSGKPERTHFSIATKIGAWDVYEPDSGRIAVEYKNISHEVVTIDIFQVQRICDAEACKLLDPSQKGRWLV